jgi:hypothetical protein
MKFKLYLLILGISSAFLVPQFSYASNKNTFDLIEEALGSGQITIAQAVLYRALAFRGDPGLPEQFVGNPGAPQKNTAPSDLQISTLVDVLPDLNPAEELIALRLMAPPAYVPNLFPGTEIPPEGEDYPKPSPNDNWTHLDTLDAKIWYLINDPKGELFAKAAHESYSKILQTLQNITGRTPLSDEFDSHEYVTKTEKKVIIGNGGDKKTDIYILPFPNVSKTMGYSVPFKGGGSKDPSSGFIVISSTGNSNNRVFNSTLMHEAMHLVQFSYPKKISHSSTYKIGEGVSTWSEEEWDKKSQYEHPWVDFFRLGWLSLKDQSYATWPFYYFLTHELGTNIIDDIYKLMATNDPYKAIDVAIPNGFKGMWPDYTIREWNQYPPLDDNSFKKWDEFSEVPFEDDNHAVKTKLININMNQGDYLFKKEMALKPLSRAYFDFEVPDLSLVRSLSIGMSHYWLKSKIALRALIQYESGWKIEKWDNQYENKQICLDKKDERISRIILIYDNYDYKDSAPAKFEVNVSATNMACNGFQGRVETNIRTKDGNATSSLIITSDLQFVAAKSKIDEVEAGPHFPGRFNLFALKSTYHFSATDSSNCKADKGDTIELAGEKMAKYGSIELYSYNDHTTGNYRIVSGAVGHPLDTPITITYHCPDGKTYSIPFALSILDRIVSPTLPPNTSVIEGKTLNPNIDAKTFMEYKYKFYPITQ